MILERNTFTYFADEDVGKDISMFSKHRMDAVYCLVECGRNQWKDLVYLKNESRAELASLEAFDRLPTHLASCDDFFSFVENIVGEKFLSKDFKKWVTMWFNPARFTKIYIACDSDMSDLGGGRKFTYRKFDFIEQKVTSGEGTSPYQREYTAQANKEFSRFIDDTSVSSYQPYDAKEHLPSPRKKASWLTFSFDDEEKVRTVLSKESIFIDFYATRLTSKKAKKAFIEEHGFIWNGERNNIGMDILVIGDNTSTIIKERDFFWTDFLYYYYLLPEDRRPILARESTFFDLISMKSKN